MDRNMERLILSGGLEAFVAKLRKEWKHSFWILDWEGHFLYGAGLFPAQEDIRKFLTRELDYFHDEKLELSGCRAETESCRMMLVLGSVAKETPELRERLKAYRQELLLCCRLMETQNKRMRQREQDIIDVLFGRRTGIEEFLETSVLKAVGNYPYVVQLIFSRSIEPREKFEKAAGMLENYMKEKGFPFLRPIFWREHLVHIMPVLYERQSFEISLKWPEQSVFEEFRLQAEAACDMKLAIGIGNSYPLKSIYRSYDEAYQACRYQWREQADGYVQRFCDLGYFAFLLSAPEEKQRKHVERWLDPIMTYDHSQHTELMPLLEFLLRHTFDWKVAVEHFHVKTSTLHYRVHRMEQLLGCSILGNERVKFELFTALKLRDVLMDYHDPRQGMIGRI